VRELRKQAVELKRQMQNLMNSVLQQDEKQGVGPGMYG
jgi:hypothetical protein